MLAAVLTLSLLAQPVPARAGEGDSVFDALAREFLDHWLSTRPHVATRLGLHDRDGELVPVSQTLLDGERAWYRSFETRFARFKAEHPRSSLSFDHQLDEDVLGARLDRERLDLEVLRPYETNPNAYLALVAGSIQSLLDRSFASPCARLQQAARRLERVPEVLRAAKVNLAHPSRIATETAIAQFDGVLRLYCVDLPAAVRACRDPGTQGRITEADTNAVHAVEDFISFLRVDLLPRSDGSFALGPVNYARKLRAEEMEVTPVDSLLARGLGEIEATRARMGELAERIAPGQGVEAALESLAADHPADSALVPFVASRLDTIRAFLRTHPILTLPARENLRVRETPSWNRGLSFASLDAPGVWERRATEAFYNVTPVDPAWTERQRQDHLGFFNRHAAEIVTIHEALPGHYYQHLALREARSRIRQVFTSTSYSEGWAHYCEQMMVEEGYGGGDPRTALAQQYQALQRLGRLVVGISMHTKGMTYDDAERLFRERCWLAPVNAAREARRGTLDPTYLVYTLGKWRILDLRDEVRSRLGPRFELRRFHDALLRQGGSALPVVRAGVLHDLGIPDTTSSAMY